MWREPKQLLPQAPPLVLNVKAHDQKARVTLLQLSIWNCHSSNPNYDALELHYKIFASVSTVSKHGTSHLSAGAQFYHPPLYTERVGHTIARPLTQTDLEPNNNPQTQSKFSHLAFSLCSKYRSRGTTRSSKTRSDSN